MILLRGLVCLAGLLAALVAAELAGEGGGAAAGPDIVTPALATPSAAPKAIRPARDAAALVTVILARPVFSPSRRPDVKLAEAAAVDVIALPRLAGTIVIGRQQRVALIVPTDSPRAILLHEGERTGRFKVTRIAPGRVDAEGPAGPLTLHVGASPAETVPVAPPEPMVNPRNRLPTEQDE